MPTGSQIKLLLWKNWTLHKRQKIRLFVEIMWPAVLCLGLVWLRKAVPLHQHHQSDANKKIERGFEGLHSNKDKCFVYYVNVKRDGGDCPLILPPGHFPNKAMPSAGIFPWIQGMFCNVNNPCFQYPTPGESPGLVSNYQNSILARFYGDVQELLLSDPNFQQMGRLWNELTIMSTFMDTLRNNPTQISGRGLKIKDVLKDNETLSFFLMWEVLLPDFVIHQLVNAQVRLEQFASGVPDLRLKDLACSQALLERYIIFPSPEGLYAVREAVCTLSQQKLHAIEESMYHNIDFFKLFRLLPRVLDRHTTGPDLLLWGKVLSGMSKKLHQLSARNSSKDLLQVLSPLFQAGGASSVSQFMDAASSLFCGYPKEAGSRVLSINWYEEKMYKGFFGINSTKEWTGYVYDKTASPNCNALMMDLESNPISRVIWASVKPLLMGKILYTPDSPAVRQILRRANATFEQLRRLQGLGKAWEEVTPQLWAFFQNSVHMNMVRDIIMKPIVADFLDMSVESIGFSSRHILNFLFTGPPTDRSCDMPNFDWRNILSLTDQGIQLLNQYTECLDLNKFVGLSDEGQMMVKALDLQGENKLWAGLVFLDMTPWTSELPAHIKFKIRMDIDSVERTNKIKNRFWNPGPRADPFGDLRYVWGGFAYLQDMIEHGIIKAQTNTDGPLGVYLQQMPYPCYVDDLFMSMFSHIFPTFVVLAWVYSASMLVKSIVLEKEMRLKETLKAMGVTSGVMWTSWFTESFLMMTVNTALVTTIIMTGKVLNYSNPIILFLFLLLFATATITQCFLMSVFFDKANLSAACSGIIYVTLYLPHILCLTRQDHITKDMKIMVSLLSPVAFGFGVEYLAWYEETGQGLQWDNIQASPLEGDEFSFLISIQMMLFDTFLYAFLAWYLDNVFPGQYGTGQPFYFPLQPSYWLWYLTEPLLSDSPASENLGSAALEKQEGHAGIESLGAPGVGGKACKHQDRQEQLARERKEPPSRQEEGEGNMGKEEDTSGNFFEAEPSDLAVGVSMQDLVKIFSSGSQPAVDHLTINFYEGQITCFLGQNGAGKTTVMSILTGLFPPTSGTAYINSMDIRTSLDAIRPCVGMCPQHNILFHHLTVAEQILFLLLLKERTMPEALREVENILEDVGLFHKRNEEVQNLSGGLQRKLSVSMAFMGGTKVVILDEPTSGVDPISRQSIWDFLLKYRAGRTVVLSTHHMDEADLLSDRVAIISKGQLLCCGSPLFLKSQLGSGFYLTLVRHRRGQQNAEKRRECDCSSNCNCSVCMKFKEDIQSQPKAADQQIDGDVEVISALIRHHIPEARLIENRGLELTFLLPGKYFKSQAYVGLFRELEQMLLDLGLTTFGVSDTSLEEIFLKVTANGEAESGSVNKPEDLGQGLLDSSAGKGLRKVKGLNLVLKQLFALLVKRFHRATRNQKDFLAQVVLPAVFVAMALMFSHVVTAFDEYPSLTLTPWIYDWQFTFFSNERALNPEMVYFGEVLLNKPGFGTRCMVDEPLGSQSMPQSKPRAPSSGVTKYSKWLMKLLLAITTCRDFPCNNVTTPWEVPPVSPGVAKMLLDPQWSDTNPSPSCQCSNGGRLTLLPTCPEGAGGLPPPQRIQPTGDVLHDLTGKNISDYLVKTYPTLIRTSLKSKYWVNEQRYGGISVGGQLPVLNVNPKTMQDVLIQMGHMLNITGGKYSKSALQEIGPFLKYTEREYNVKVWYNNKGWHSMVSFMNVANNAILRSNLPSNTGLDKYGITTINQPLNLTKEQHSKAAVLKTLLDAVTAICVVFAISLIPASFVLHLIQERVTKAKHLQLVSGVSPLVYWMANFLWDMINYSFCSAMVVGVFSIFNIKCYTSPANLRALVALLFSYGWSVTPLMYLLSYAFNVPSTAYVLLACINLLIGINTTAITFILELYENNKVLLKFNESLKDIFLIFPHFCLGRGLIDMAVNQALTEVHAHFGETYSRNLFSWNFVGKNLVVMAVEGFIYFFFNILIQYSLFIHFWRAERMKTPLIAGDDDIMEERVRIHNGGCTNDILQVKDLSKTYHGQNKPAVDGICLGVSAGECFGLLGVNGAGKTTTFKMLTGDTDVSFGDATIAGYSVLTNILDVHQNIGYCPQFNAVDDSLTGREHLYLYARLRGIPESEISGVAEWGILNLGLSGYADHSAGTYSSGNKRKLSTAIAMIGSPALILLDEPTMGMDPHARRFLRHCITNVIRDGRAVVLTSHSIEECEALCTHLAIMVNGDLKCLGTTQHLKHKFGNGYVVTMKMRASKSAVVAAFLQSSFPDCVQRERHCNTLQFKITSSSLAHVFQLVLANKEKLGVDDYSISQTTPDQVFMNFTKLQEDVDSSIVLPPRVTGSRKDAKVAPVKVFGKKGN